MKVKNCVILLLFFVFLVLVLNTALVMAQKTVGARTEAPPYAALEIVTLGDRGLHLPVFSGNAARNRLVSSSSPEETKIAARGLMIYNKSQGNQGAIEYWDGKQWQTMPQTLPAGNLSSKDLIIQQGERAIVKNDLELAIKDHSLGISHLNISSEEASNDTLLIISNNSPSPLDSNKLGASLIKRKDYDARYAAQGDTSWGVGGNTAGIGGLPLSSTSPLGLWNSSAHAIEIDLNQRVLRLENSSANFSIRSGSAPYTQTLRVNSQGAVGIRLQATSDTAEPQNMPILDINGALTLRETSAKVSGTLLDLSIPSFAQASQIEINGSPSSDFTIKMPQGVAGQQLILVNNSTKDGNLPDFSLLNSTVRQFVYSGIMQRWVPTTTSSTVKVMYFGRIGIPPFKDGLVSSGYDTDDWKCSKVKLIQGLDASSKPSMIVSYEYLGREKFPPNSLIMFTPISSQAVINDPKTWTSFSLNVQAFDAQQGITIQEDENGKQSIQLYLTQLDSNDGSSANISPGAFSANIMISSN